jgi:hypothetical protein
MSGPRLAPLDPDAFQAWLWATEGGAGRPPTVRELWQGIYHYAEQQGLECPTFAEYRREILALAARRRRDQRIEFYGLALRLPWAIQEGEEAG